jgi:hypothetical protein
MIKVLPRSSVISPPDFNPDPEAVTSMIIIRGRLATGKSQKKATKKNLGGKRSAMEIDGKNPGLINAHHGLGIFCQQSRQFRWQNLQGRRI